MFLRIDISGGVRIHQTGLANRNCVMGMMWCASLRFRSLVPSAMDFMYVYSHVFLAQGLAG